MVQDLRFFVSYTGVGLPLKLVHPIAADALGNRNTFIRALYENDALIGLEKVVYGEVELAHRYAYHANGNLKTAEIVMLDEETAVLRFDEAGVQIAHL